MNRKEEWTDFEKVMDEKYSFIDNAFRKKKKWLAGFISCAVVIFYFSICIFSDTHCDPAWERIMFSHFKTWEKSGKPQGEKLVQLVKTEGWESSASITNIAFNIENQDIEALFVRPSPSGILFFKKSLFILKNGDLVWVSNRSGKILEIKRYSDIQKQSVKNNEKEYGAIAMFIKNEKI